MAEEKAMWIFFAHFPRMAGKSTNMWIFEAGIHLCRGGVTLSILLSYSQFKGQAHRTKEKKLMGQT